MDTTMWTDITRAQHARKHCRLPSDLTDAEWALIEPLLPPRKARGRPAKWSYRQIVEAMLYVLRGGIAWRMLPPSLFPPMTTVQHYFYVWRDSGLWQTINHTLLMAAREAEVSLGNKVGSSSYVERPGWQGILCVNLRRTVQSYVRPVGAVI
tara:strand:- start:757 stop:1212 length:456 start_codon:yes stop_codon:yes gene_type:complete